MKARKYVFQSHGDDRGQLVALEERSDYPFNVKRVYYIYETAAGVRRGYHAHRVLEQVLVCVHGSCWIMLDDGHDRVEVFLDSPNEGLYVGPGTWREMHDFSPEAVLLVLASELYDEDDYIRDYNEFLKAVRADGSVNDD